MNLVFKNLDDKIIDIAHSFVIGLDDKDKARKLTINQGMIYRDFLEAIGHPETPTTKQAYDDLQRSFEILWEQKNDKK